MWFSYPLNHKLHSLCSGKIDAYDIKSQHRLASNGSWSPYVCLPELVIFITFSDESGQKGTPKPPYSSTCRQTQSLSIQWITFKTSRETSPILSLLERKEKRIVATTLIDVVDNLVPHVLEAKNWCRQPSIEKMSSSSTFDSGYLASCSIFTRKQRKSIDICGQILVSNLFAIKSPHSVGNSEVISKILFKRKMIVRLGTSEFLGNSTNDVVVVCNRKSIDGHTWAMASNNGLPILVISGSVSSPFYYMQRKDVSFLY